MKEETVRTLPDMLTELRSRLAAAEAKEGLSAEGKERIREALEIAALMEDAIAAALEEVPEETLGSLSELEYTAHTIGTPDAANAPEDIEDIALDADGSEEMKAPALADEEIIAAAKTEDSAAEEGNEDESSAAFSAEPIEHGALLAASLALEKKAEEALRLRKEEKKTKKHKDKKKKKKEKKKDKK